MLLPRAPRFATRGSGRCAPLWTPKSGASIPKFATSGKNIACFMGTQAGWQPDWGWGMLDLSAALAQRLNFAGGSVTGGSARFYRSTVAQGDRATLTWNRRTVGCVGPGCMPEGLTLSNLDLEQIDESGAVLNASASGIDNVEQLRAPAGGTGSVIYKVKASSEVDGLPAEPFAIAAKNPLTPLTSPEPTAALALGAQETRPGENVAIGATVSNPSPDLEAEAAEATLELPPGVELVGGTQTQTLGTLAKRGEAGDSATAGWTVRGTSDGVKQIVVRTHATKYGEGFSGEGSAVLTVQSPATAPLPPPAVAPPPTAAPPPSTLPPPAVARVSPVLRLRSAVLGNTTLRVSGSTRADVRGELTLTYSTISGGRRVRAGRRAVIRGGRFVVTIRLPRSARLGRRGSLVVRYGGDLRHLPESARRSVRRAR